MTLFTASSEPIIERSVLVLALSGWVDSAAAATDAAEFIADQGVEIGAFDGDALFDYRSSRPVLHFRDGDLAEIAWPQLRVFHTAVAGRDFVVVHGNEPDFRWQRLSSELVALARRLNVELMLTLGSIPAMVPHTRPTVEVVSTAADASLLLVGDQLLEEDLVVPGAAVSVLRRAVYDAGIDTVGYWVRAPHYLTRPWYDGVLALLDRVSRQAGAPFANEKLVEQAENQRRELDRIASERSEIGAYIAKLEAEDREAEEQGGLRSTFGGIPSAEELAASAEELAAEVERYLQEAAGDE